MNTSDIVTHIIEEMPKFSWHDYLFFIILLLLSMGIGIYFGFIKKSEESVDDYLLGGKEMGVFEISMSLIASTISGLTILSIPAEIYRFGISYWYGACSAIGVLIFSYFCVLPVFIKLKTPSTYAYLNSRFDESIQGISSFLFTLSMFFYLPIVIYLPALALAQGTGFNIHYITPLICGVCIFYTTIGGLKAVVWTDALQFVVMIGAAVVIIIIGTNASGGFSNIMSTSTHGGRLELSVVLDPTLRDTVWSTVIGMFFLWNSVITFGQGTVQKCLALPNKKKMRLAYLIYGAGLIGFLTFSVYIGLAMYAKYRDCDPFFSKQIDAHDQILPMYILQVAGHVPGLPGVFVAGVFSASLSTMSAAMNALSCTIFQDFIERHLPKTVTSHHINLILKAIVVVVGVICTALVFVVQNFKSILEIGYTFNSLTQGPIIGLFALGMFVPKANSKGALFGTLGALMIMSWIIFTSLYYKITGYIINPSLEVSTEGCVFSGNSTARPIPELSEWTPHYLYRISHYFYGLMGGLLVFIIGIPVSYFTKTNDEKPVERDLISPAIHWALGSVSTNKLSEYNSVERANQLVSDHKGESCYISQKPLQLSC